MSSLRMCTAALALALGGILSPPSLTTLLLTVFRFATVSRSRSFTASRCRVSRLLLQHPISHRQRISLHRAACSSTCYSSSVSRTATTSHTVTAFSYSSYSCYAITTTTNGPIPLSESTATKFDLKATISESSSVQPKTRKTKTAGYQKTKRPISRGIIDDS